MSKGELPMMNTRCTKLSMVRDDSKSSKTSNKKCPVVLHSDHNQFQVNMTYYLHMDVRVLDGPWRFQELGLGLINWGNQLLKNTQWKWGWGQGDLKLRPDMRDSYLIGACD